MLERVLCDCVLKELLMELELEIVDNMSNSSYIDMSSYIECSLSNAGTRPSIATVGDKDKRKKFRSGIFYT